MERTKVVSDPSPVNRSNLGYVLALFADGVSNCFKVCDKYTRTNFDCQFADPDPVPFEIVSVVELGIAVMKVFGNICVSVIGCPTL